MNNLFCIECGEEDNVQILTEEKTVNIKNTPITATFTYRKCFDCNAVWESSGDPDGLVEAYRKYKEQNNMMLPEDIIALRKKYNLTQRELASLIGCGEITITRYENGSLQSNVHETLLRMMKSPRNLMDVLHKRPDAIKPEKYHALWKQLDKEIRIECNLQALHYSHEREACIKNGFITFQYEKLEHIMMYLCFFNTLSRLALVKHLFYIDFYHYQRYGRSITGAKYVRITHGPVPEDYKKIYNILLDKGLLECEQKNIGHRPNGEPILKYLYSSKVEPDMSIFCEEELETIERIKEQFKNFSPTKLRDISHTEDAYLETLDQEIISYEYAETLHFGNPPSDHCDSDFDPFVEF